MAIGESQIERWFFEDPHGGQPKTTPIIEFANLGFTTIIGPVPPGRVWRVVDVDCKNDAAGPIQFIVMECHEAGGFVFRFQVSIFIAAGVGCRLPYSLEFTGPLEDQMQPWTFNLVEGDELKLNCSGLPVGADPQARCSYWDLPA